MRGRIGVSRQAAEEKQYWKVRSGVSISHQAAEGLARLGRCGADFSFLVRVLVLGEAVEGAGKGGRFSSDFQRKMIFRF